MSSRSDERRQGGHVGARHPHAAHAGADVPITLSTLQRALKLGEFFLHYQPIITLGTGQVTGFEALIRWHSPVYGELLPNAFIPLAEETGLIDEIGLWVTREAASICVMWREMAPHNDLFVSINVSARQLSRERFPDTITQIIRSAGLPPGAIMLEITETSRVPDFASAAQGLHLLQGLGVHLAADDIGHGHMNLSALSRLPVDLIKIPRPFLQKTAPLVHRHMLEAIVAFAKVLGVQTIVEGIETQEEFRRAIDAGCGAGQGFYFSPPLSQRRVSEFVESGATLIRDGLPADV